MYLAGFRNRLSVLVEWGYSFFTYQRGARLITAGRASLPLAAEARRATQCARPYRAPVAQRCFPRFSRSSVAAFSSDSQRTRLRRIGISGVRLEALFEAVPLAIAVFDGELRLVNANARYRELTGVRERAPDHGVHLRRVSQRARRSHRSDRHRAARRAAVHCARAVPASGRPALDRDDVLHAHRRESGGRGILFAGNDVSEREELRETLSRNVAQLESIFDVIPDSVRVFDTEGRTVRSNTQALQDHPVGQPSTLRELWQLDRPRTIDGTSLFMHEHPTARALRGERVRGETLAVRRGADSSPVIIEVNSNPLYDEHGKIRGAVTVERDVRSRRTSPKRWKKRRGARPNSTNACRRKQNVSSEWCRSARPSCSRCRKRDRANVAWPPSASLPPA